MAVTRSQLERMPGRIRRLALACQGRAGGLAEAGIVFALAAEVPEGGLGLAAYAHRKLCRFFAKEITDCGMADEPTSRLINLLGEYLQLQGYGHYDRGKWVRWPEEAGAARPEVQPSDTASSGRLELVR